MNNFGLELADLASLSPLFVILLGSLGLLILEIVNEKFSKKYSYYFTLMVLSVAFFETYQTHESKNELISHWISINDVSITFIFFFIFIGIAIVLLTSSFLSRLTISCGEFYFFLLTSLFGLILISASADFLTLFLGLETLSLSLYILCTYVKVWKISQEAAIKYFLIGSIGAAFLLYGIALIYGSIGTTQLSLVLKNYYAIDNLPDKFLFNSGIAFVTVGFLFKAAAVPFHVWAPDVYAGAPTPVTAFMSVGTKVGAFAAFTRIFLIEIVNWNPLWNEGIAIIAIVTLIYANYVAIQQTHLRRFFAYSGISHSGFILIAIAAGGEDAINALIFYLVVYAFATLGCFSVLCTLDLLKKTDENIGISVEDLKGLFYRSPYFAILFAVFLLTLAGFPPTVGFFSKFYLFKLGWEAKFYALVVIALLTTVLSAFYYLKFIMVMFNRNLDGDKCEKFTRSLVILGSICLFGIVWFSIQPQFLINLIK